MSRISTTLLALALCYTLFFTPLPKAKASAPDGPPKKEKQEEKSCATCPGGSSGKKDDWVNKLATAGRRTQQMPFAPVQRSIFDGARVNMVGTSNGSLAFAITDLKASGFIPLAFLRVYASDRREDRGLGAGWSFALDDRLRIDGDEAILSTGAGADIAFRRDGESRRFVLRTAEPGLHQSFEEAPDGTLVESAAGMTRTYQKVAAEYRLASVADQNGNAIAISFDRQGNISRVDSGGGGRSLKLSWSGGKQSRLLSVTDNIGRRTSFESRGGSLASVVDQAGSRWTYEYAGGRLVGASDPMGRVVLRARYDGQGRAVEVGDAVGSHIYEYGEGRRTTITDPIGAKISFTHNALGAVAAATDDEGQTATIEYNEANRPTRASDSKGNEQMFASEAGSKGAAGAQSTGGGIANTYDARGNVLKAQSGDSATSYRAVRNRRGQALSLKAESGFGVTIEYDAAGNETAFTYSDMGRFEQRFDGAGRRIASRLPSGLSSEYEYDAHGELARVTDSSGRTQIIERDASGLPARITAADGTQIRATRDAAGRITRLEAADGRSRQFAYDARGAMTYFRDALGRQYSMSYDRRGRLQKVDKSDGVTLRYQYGRDGRVASVSREKRSGAKGFVKASFNSLLPRAILMEFGDLYDCVFMYDFLNYCDPCTDPYCSFQGWGAPPRQTMTPEQCRYQAWLECKGDFTTDLSLTYVGYLGVVFACLEALASTVSGLALVSLCLGLGWLVLGAGAYASVQRLESCQIAKMREMCPGVSL